MEIKEIHVCDDCGFEETGDIAAADPSTIKKFKMTDAEMEELVDEYRLLMSLKSGLRLINPAAIKCTNCRLDTLIVTTREKDGVYERISSKPTTCPHCGHRVKDDR
jgi:hypothetical protein